MHQNLFTCQMFIITWLLLLICICHLIMYYFYSVRPNIWWISSNSLASSVNCLHNSEQIYYLTSNEYCFVGGTAPSSLCLRGRKVWLRKRPVSSRPKRLRLMIEEMSDNCQLLQRKCAPFPNKLFGKNIVFVVIDTKSRSFHIRSDR